MAQNLPLTDPVKQHASIYFKGHVTRSLEAGGSSSSELFQLADLAIAILLSKNVAGTLKSHVQEALQLLVKTDNKKQNNVLFTESLFTEFLGNRLKIDQFNAL